MEAGSKVVLGVRNQPLKAGADSLLAGDYEEGVRLTHRGLAQALGSREEEAGLSNLCAGYLQLGKYVMAMQYCDMLLVRNEKNWRGYNNRALIYIKTKQWDKAEADLIKGEELNGSAYTLKVARSMYMDAVHPVAPEIEIDDREIQNREEKK
jgi:tetratricopeptide (TPR) repeat protein